MKVQDIDVSKVVVTDNVRLGHGDAEIKSLMSSIQQHGLKEPIGVSENGDGKYTLIYGFRRFLAFKKLGYKTIPAVLDDTSDAKDHLIVNAIENIQRRGITPAELGRVSEKLTIMGLTTGEIAARMNVTESSVKRSIAIFKHIPDRLRDKVSFFGAGNVQKKGDISSNTAYTVLETAKTFALTKEETGKLLDHAREDELSYMEMIVIASLLKKGLTINQAVKRMDDYHISRTDIIVEKKELKQVREKYKVGIQDAMKLSLYGKIPPFTQPDFEEIEYKKEK